MQIEQGEQIRPMQGQNRWHNEGRKLTVPAWTYLFPLSFTKKSADLLKISLRFCHI